MKSTAIFLPRFSLGSSISRILATICVYLSIHGISLAQPDQLIIAPSDPLPNALVTDNTYTVTASATSGLPVVYGLVSDPNGCVASFDANTGVFTLTDSNGLVTVSIDQPGDMVWNPAPQVVRTFRVKIPQSINAAADPLPIGLTTDNTYTVTASATSGLPVVYGLVSDPNGCVASLDANTGVFTLTDSNGLVTVSIDQPGDMVWNPAPQVVRTFRVKIPQSINAADPLPIGLTTANTYTVTATATSGLPVTYGLVSDPDNCVTTFNQTTGVFNLTDNHGLVTVSVSQAGNDTYAAATTITRTFRIKIPQTINITDFPPGIIYSNEKVASTYAVAEPSGLPITYSISTNPANLATIDANGVITLTPQPGINMEGSATVTYTQSGDDTYAPVTLTAGFSILRQSQFMFLTLERSEVEFGASPVRIRISSDSGLPADISIESIPAGIATLDGGVTELSGRTECYLTLNNRLDAPGTGTVIITATQNGNNFYLSDTDTAEIQIRPATMAMSYIQVPLGMTYLGAAQPIVALWNLPSATNSNIRKNIVSSAPATLLNATLDEAGAKRATVLPAGIFQDGYQYNYNVTPDLGSGPVIFSLNLNPAADPFNNLNPVFSLDANITEFEISPTNFVLRFLEDYPDITFGEFPFSIAAEARHPTTNDVLNTTTITYGVADGPAYLGQNNNVITYGTGRVLLEASATAVDVNLDGEFDFLAQTVQESYVSRSGNLTSGQIFLDRWTWRNPNPSGKFYNDVIFTDRYVAVGDAGRVSVTDSGASGYRQWMINNVAGVPSATNLNGLAYSGILYVAVGDDGVAYYTNDATMPWTATTVDLNTSLTSVEYANGIFMATGSNGSMYSSLDGINWLPGANVFPPGTESNSIQSLNSTVYIGNNTWISVGDRGTVAYSVDNGNNWSLGISGTVLDLNAVSFQLIQDPLDPFNRIPQILAVGDSGIILSSEDGEHWITENSPTTEDLYAISVATHLQQNDPTDPLDDLENYYYIVLGVDGKVLTSRDGFVWTDRVSRFLNDYAAAVFANGFFIAVGDNYSIFSSPTGESWSLLESDQPESIYNAVFGNGTYVAVGQSGTILTSTDANSWTPVSPAPTTEDLRGITYGNNRFVTVGTNGTFLVSDDAVTWTPAASTPSGSANYSDVTYDGQGQFVAVGEDFYIAISNDGTNWVSQPVTFGTRHDLHDVEYAAQIDTYVAVGDNGTILISNDGLNWRFRYLGIANNLTGVSYGAELGKFVVVGDNGIIATSNFGDVWQYVTSGTTYHINSIAYLADEAPAVGGTFVAVGENFQILASRDGVEWSVQISGNLNSLWGVVHANNTFVAVGEHQTILTSTTAIPSGLDEWRQYNPLPDDLAFRSIIYENNTYVAVGDQGKILTSNDGFTWTERSSGTSDNITDVTYGNDRFVAVGGQSILTSTNGITWTTQRTWHFPLNAVSYLNGLFVAVGNGGLVLTSSNGTDWILGGAFPYAKTEPNLFDISYGNGLFIVVGSSVSVDMICAGQVRTFEMSAISVSPDGIRWTQMIPPIIGFTSDGCPVYLSATLLGVDYGNGVFMLVGDTFSVLRWDGNVSNIVAGIGLPFVASSDFDLTISGTGTLNKVAYGDGNGVGRFTVVGNGGILFTTIDGTEYELRYPGITNNLNNVVFGNETYLVVGDSGRILSSSNGTVWTSLRSSGFISTINDFGYNGSQLVAGADNGRILTSPDGINWTEQVSGTTLNINSIVYGREKFVAVTDRGWSVTSSDGVSWTPIFSGFLDDFNDALFYQEGELQVFYVVCSNGLILSSSDGQQWNLETSNTTNHLFALTRGADKFVAIGAKGTIIYSLDGTNWKNIVSISPAVNFDFQDVSYGNGVYVTVGRFGSIYRSTDGLNWTKQNSLTDYRLDSIHYGDGFFVATGQEGTVLTSNDGISWKKRPPVTRSSLLAGRYADGLFIAGGDFGTIVTSGELVVKIPQTIFFPKIDNIAVYDSNNPDSKSQFPLKAVASSGLDVVYRITAGSTVASVSNNLITLVENEAGDVTVQADQPGNKNYLPAEPVSRTFSVIPSNHSIDFPAIPNAVFKQGPITLAATSSEGLEVSYRIIFGPGSIDGDQLNLLGAGLITVEAFSNGDDTSNPKISPASKRQSVSVAKANQVISFNAISNKSFGDPPFRLEANSDSGLPITFKINQGPATVSPDGFLTITGAGPVQVSATQLGDDNFNPAVEVVRDFLVETAPPGNVWVPASIIPALALGEDLLSVDYVGNSYLTGGTNLRLFRSVDGNEWSVVTTGVGTITASAFGNGLYLALSGNLILSSLNGIDWILTPTNLPNTVIFDDIVFADGRFVAVGNAVASSVNGVDWELADVSALLGTASLTSIAHGNSMYVAVGTAGAILKGVENSQGDLVWTAPTVLLPGNLNDVVYGNGIFVSVGDQNNVRTSSDGLNWTIRSISGGNFNSVTYGNNRYLTVGDGGIIYSSQDSINWTSRNSGISTNLNAVTYTNNQFVAVGDGGTIITSGSVISRQAQEITFNPLANLQVGFATPLGEDTTNQGLPVTFVIFRGQADLVVVNDITYVIPQTTETLEIRATQDGDANFAPALTKAQILNVAKGDQDLTIPAGFDFSLGQPDIEIITDPAVVLSANQAHFYAVDRNNPGIATGTALSITVSGGAVGLIQVQNGTVMQSFLRILAEGQATVTVTAAGNDNYDPVTEQFTIIVSGVFPTGFILSPTDASIATATTAVFLQASAVDTGTNAGIAEVRFYANGGLIETAAALAGTSIYYGSWIPGLPGNYSITAEIEDDDGNVSVVGPNIITVVNPIGSAPMITLQAPAAGNTNSQIPLAATVADPDGSVARVEFFVNGNLVGTDVAAPYATTFSTGIAGKYILTALATDDAGNTSTSLPQVITIGDASVGEVPTVSILQPTGLSNPTSNSRLLIWAGADDLDGTVASVEFYVDGNLLGSDSSFPFTIGWTPRKAGTFTLQAVAVDNLGNRGYSTPVQITTTVSSSKSPSVTLTAPATYVVGSSIFLTGQNAIDPDGFISSAQFYLNGVPFGTPISRPSGNFTRFWSSSNQGQYVVGLTVTDNTGNTYEADPVLVTVTQSASFNVNIVQPLVTDKIPEKSQIIIEAEASNVSGSLRQMEFYVDNILIGTDTLAPYTAIWQNFSRGDHRIVVIATDISGTTASDEITVTAEEPIGTPPTVNVSITADGNLTENSQIIVYAYVEDIEDDANGLSPTVEFYLNGEQVTNLRPEAPFFARMQPVALTDDDTDPNYRNYEVQVIVRDNDNNTTIDTRNQLYSADIFVNRPILTVLAPVQNETIDEGLPFTIRAKVNGAGSSDVASVIFYENGSEIGATTTTDSSGNYTFTWTPVITNGTNSQDFVITAASLRTAISWDSNPDDLEDEFIDVTPVSLSQDIVVTVEKGSAGTAPTVSIIEPLNNASYVRGTTLDINVNADDADGIIRQVDILANGVIIAQLTQAPYFITWTPAAASTYQLTARAVDNQGNSTTSSVVNLEITAPEGNIPTVVLTSPADASTFTSSSSILLQAGAADIGGGIDKVEFIVNGNVVGSDSLAPFTYAWTPSAPGTYRVVAVATDTDDNVVRSAPISITVTPGSSQPPVVSINDPGTVVVNRDNIIQITASDEDGVVSLVELFANGTKVGEGTSASSLFQIPWRPTATGTYTLVAVATDNSANVVSAIRAVTVTNAVGLLPTVTISTPSAGESLLVAETVTIEANASDPDGIIASVQFFVNGVSLGAADIAEPFAASWTPLVSGNYTITAVALDDTGNSSTSLGVNVTVVPNQAPNVSLLSPDQAISMTRGSVYVLEADASDSDGTIASVAFTANGSILAVLDAAPYEFVWQPGQSNIYQVRAEATDNRGRKSTSAAQTVTVLAPNGLAPSAQVSAPTTEDEFTAASTILLEANALDADGTISSVEFFINGSLFGTNNTYPYVISWKPGLPGDYRLSVVARDDDSNIIYSAPVDVTALPATGVGPAVALANPPSLTRGLAAILTATASDADGVVASVEFFANGESLGQDSVAPFTVDWTPLQSGNYYLVVVATDNHGNTTTTLPVTATVSAGSAPTVSIVSPINNSSVMLNRTTTLRATAGDLDGTVQSVSFYVNGLAIGQPQTVEPFEFNWLPTITGNYTLTAVALDNAGNSTTSAPVSVGVTNAIGQLPTFISFSPANNSRVVVGRNVILDAEVSDPDGSVEDVEFFLDGVSLEIVNQEPFTTNWLPTARGTYTITAVATDNVGNTASRVVTLIADPNQRPNVSVIYPQGAASYSLGSAVSILATAGDLDGTVTFVDFQVNGNLVSRDSEAPYTASFTPTLAGTYTIRAIATDDLGAVQSSANVSFTVAAPNGQAPTVNLLSPVSGSTTTSASRHILWAGAADSDGTIASVEFFVNGVSQAVVNTAPFILPWTPGSVGSFNLQAVATDNLGNKGYSTPVTIQTVSASSAPPTVQLLDPVDYVVGGSTFLNADNAVDSDGFISTAEFFINGVALGDPISNPNRSFSRIWSAANQGQYIVGLRVTDNTGNVFEAVPQSVTVSQLAPFTIDIVSPTPTDTIPEKSQIIIEAKASGLSGSSLRQIDFYVDNQLIGTDTISPYQVIWSDFSVGAHNIIAVATDISGTTATDQQSVTVTELPANSTPPTVNVSITADGNLTENSQIIVYAYVEDIEDDNDNDPLTKPTVSFYLNGEEVAAREDAPNFVRMQPTVLNGQNYEVRVVVRDSDNNTTIDERRQLWIAPFFINRPVVTLVAPSKNDEKIAEGLTYTLQARLSGSGTNAVSSVIFYESGQEIGSSTTRDANNNYTLDWTPVITNGLTSQKYVITAAALRNEEEWDLLRICCDQSVTPVSLSQDIVVVVEKGVAGLAPTVQILEPANGARFVRGTSLDVNINADDLDGAIREVNVYANDTLLRQITQPPYFFAWTPSAAGNYALRAEAFDNQGNINTVPAIANVSITLPVGNIPTVVMTSPANNSTFTSASTILLQAGAADVSGVIREVRFYANGVLLGQPVTTAPYAYAWTPSSTGTYRIVAVATDNANPDNNPDTLDGNTVRSSPITVTITPASSQPPVVEIIDPAAGTLVVNRNNQISIRASDEDGVVTKLELFANGVTVGTATSSNDLFEVTWRPTAEGNYTLVAVVTDDSGNIASDTLGVTVTSAPLDPYPPQVQMLTPSSNAELPVGAPVTISAMAWDTNPAGNPGLITGVRFYVNGVALGEADTTEPFSAAWTPLVSGTYSIKALATDNSGSIAESSITVSVVGNKAPVVEIVHPVSDISFTLGSTYTLAAEAGDEDGSIASVVFSANGIVLQTITSEPYEFDWLPTAVSTVNQGRYLITAEAIDDRGRRSSDTVTITVKAPSGKAPEVSIVAPEEDEVFTASSTMLVEMRALDADGTIANIQLYVNGNLQATLSSYPYATTWKPGLAGDYKLFAVATDNNNNVVYSTPVTVTATNSIGLGPVLALTNPGKATKGTATTLAASAADPDGNIRQVEFFANGESVGVDTVAPFRATWTPGQAGTYYLVAVATDNVGNTTATLPTAVTVEDGKSPTISVSVQNTANGKILVNRAAVVEAIAADEDGQVTSVQLFINDIAQEPMDTTFPYLFQFQPGSTGIYAIHAEATDNAGNTTNSNKVTVEVANVIGQAPQAAITYPMTGATLVVGRTINMNISATDPDGLITAVELWQTPALGGLIPTLLGTTTSEPFSFTWTPLVSGNYSFYAEAVDKTGKRFTSNTINVVAASNQAPAASLVFPAPTATSTYTLGSTVPLVAEVGDVDGSVSSVQFFVNNLSVGSDDTEPYIAQWTPTATGTYRIKVVATDDLGAVSSSAEATVIMASVAGTIEPSVALLEPISGLTFSAASTVMLDATVTDDESVTDVTFYANGEKIGSGLTNDAVYFMQSWQPGVAGDYLIVAIATDEDGNKVISDPLEVVATVGSGKAPTIETPALPSTATRSLTTIITVSAQDADGRVSMVDFYADGELLGSDNNAPFTLRWTPTEPGLYNIFAVATDNRGNVTTSGVKSVTVDDLNDPFNLEITAPTSDTLRLGSDVIIEAVRASDTTRIVQTVNFYVNDNLVGEDSVAPYTVVWTPEATGTQVIRVEATDVLGNTSAAASKTILIEPVSTSNLPPELEVSLTADGNITDNSNIIVTTQIYDEMPSTLEVTYYLNGQEITPIIHEDVSANGIYPLISDAPGKSQFGVSYAIIRPRTISDDPNTSNYRSYELRIIARDEAGNSKASIIDNVFIDTRNLSRPSAILTTSAANNTLDSGNSVTLTANIIGSNQDDIGKVIFYANGQRIGEDTTAPYTIDWLPPSPELNQTDNYYLSASVMRNSYTYDLDPSEAGVNLFTFTPVSVSSELKLSVAYVDPGPNPIVQFITPDLDESFSLGDAIDLTSNATVEGRSIRQIEYFVTRYNGNNPVTAERTIGTASAEPFAVTYTPVVEGRYQFVARATSSTGKVGEAVIFINVYDGAIPEVTKIEANVASNIVFTGTEVSFTVEASVADGIAYVEIYRLGYPEALAADSVEPYVFKGDLSFDPGYPYDLQYQVYYAIAYSKKGIPGRSEDLVMTILAPHPDIVDVEHNQDYIAQTHEDLLLRPVTDAESETLGEELYDARVTLANARAQMMQKVMESAEFLPVLDIHSLYYLFYSRWPTREEVEVAYAIYATYGFDGLVQEHLSTTNNLGAYETIPTYQSSPGDIRKFLELLYRLKYETDRYNGDHLNRLTESFSRSSLDVFLANWVMDTGLFGGSTSYSRIFRLENPPNDNLYRWAQTAVLYTSVRRTTVGHDTVKAESSKALLDRIKSALNSGEYNDRFESRIPFDPDAIGYAGAWYLSQWFGWYNTTFYPWIYHGDHGWVYLHSQPKDNMWIYTMDMGWIWTSNGYYPFLYRANDQQWLWYQMGSQNPRVFVTTSGQVENR